MVSSSTDQDSFLSPSSNNGEGNSLIVNSKHKVECCYKYNKIDNTVGYVLNPRIDFLIITIKITDDDVKGALALFLAHDIMDKQKSNHVPFYKEHVPDKAKYYYQKYKRCIRLTDFPGLAAIQAKPENNTYNFLKITLIPSRWTKEDVKAFWKYLEEISLGAIDADYVAEHGYVRRIDWAIDFLHVETSDFHLHKKTKNKRKSIAYISTEGGIETFYVGPNSKKLTAQNSKAYIYDKMAKAKQKAADVEIKKGINTEPNLEFGDIGHTRFEVRINKDMLGKFQLKSLVKSSGHLTNRFAAYSLTDFQAAMPDNEKVLWPFFNDSCKLKGIDQAILMLPKEKRASFKKAVNKAQKDCWQPEKLWKAISKHVHFILGKELD